MCESVAELYTHLRETSIRDPTVKDTYGLWMHIVDSEDEDELEAADALLIESDELLELLVPMLVEQCGRLVAQTVGSLEAAAQAVHKRKTSLLTAAKVLFRCIIVNFSDLTNSDLEHRSERYRKELAEEVKVNEFLLWFKRTNHNNYEDGVEPFEAKWSAQFKNRVQVGIRYVLKRRGMYDISLGGRGMLGP